NLIVVANRLGELPLLLEREAGPGESAIAHGGIVGARLRRGPERLERGARALLLELALPQQELGLGADAGVVALGRAARERRRFLEAPTAEGPLGEIERRARGERMIGKVLAEGGPCRLGILRAIEPGRD